MHPRPDLNKANITSLSSLDIGKVASFFLGYYTNRKRTFWNRTMEIFIHLSGVNTEESWVTMLSTAFSLDCETEKERSRPPTNMKSRLIFFFPLQYLQFEL